MLLNQADAHLDLVRALASFVPPAVARAVQADPRQRIAPTSARLTAAVLLADVSGFTALTGALAARGAPGVEELTALVNRYFTRMIGLLEAAGGEVVQFSGDALLAVFPADPPECLATATAQARAVAEQMQAAMAEFTALPTSVGARGLAMKIVIGAGELLTVRVGGHVPRRYAAQRWHSIAAGEPLNQVSRTEPLARRGDVLLSPEAQRLVQGVAEVPAPQPVEPIDWSRADATTLDTLRACIPYPITARLEHGLAGWLAELRRMSVLFLGVSGLEEADLERFQACMQALQEIAERYEGSINKFQVDDKGVIGIVLFGAPPLAHADDPLRAVRAALDLQQASAALQVRIAIGITTGQVFAGPVGSPTRREYTVMGAVVNTAARFMQSAGAGGVICDAATYRAIGVDLHWETLPPLALKGVDGPVPAYRPTGVASAAEVRRARREDERPLVGRIAEQAALALALDELGAGNGRLVLIEGDEGIGKSRLAEELIGQLSARGLSGLIGAAQSLTRETPYNAWREIYSASFGLDQLHSAAERRTQTLQQLAQFAPRLIERAPLLSDLLALDLADNALTAGLDPERRQAALADLLVELLRIRAAVRPLALIIEDAHWLDPLGWVLLNLARRALANAPLLIVLIRRSHLPDSIDPLAELHDDPGLMRLTLGPLAPAEAAQLAAQRLGVTQISPNLETVIGQRAAGNPLVIEALALSLRERDDVVVAAGAADLRGDPSELRLPDSLQSLVLDRLDRLPSDVQLTLKVAAVIGPSFSQAALAQVHPIPEQRALLREQLNTLIERDLIAPAASASVPMHRFRQVVLQEMAYSTILPTQRRELHARVGAWYEQEASAAQSGAVAQLVYHWHHAGDTARESRYALLAGRLFAAEYANSAALNYLERALTLTESPVERRQIYWQRLQIHERTGARAAQQADLVQLEQITTSGVDRLEQARLANAWAAYHRDRSEYPAALARLDAAQALARQAADLASEARSLTLRGELYAIQGELTAARDCFEQALAAYRSISYRRGEANNLSKLGNLAYFQGDIAAARDLFLQTLAIRRADRDADECYTLNDLGETAVKLGDWAAGRGYWREALAAAERVGNRSAAALVLSQLGYAALAHGDYSAALNDLSAAAHEFQVLGDRRREAETLNDLGMLYRDVGAFADARACFERALTSQDAIGDVPNAAFTALNLGRLLIDVDRTRAAALYQRALGYALASQERETEAYARSYLAHLAEQAGQPAVAEAEYAAAMALRTELELPVVEELAGLARVALARQDVAAAAAYAQVALQALAVAGVEAVEFPLLVYLSCYDALHAAERAVGAGTSVDGAGMTAREVVQAAHTLLMERAASIDDPALRKALLEQAPINRRVVALYAGFSRDLPLRNADMMPDGCDVMPDARTGRQGDQE
jgi:class 3 adenylate cyclase/tetratricopeptide (TPR) repeat protein